MSKRIVLVTRDHKHFLKAVKRIKQEGLPEAELTPRTPLGSTNIGTWCGSYCTTWGKDHEHQRDVEYVHTIKEFITKARELFTEGK